MGNEVKYAIKVKYGFYLGEEAASFPLEKSLEQAATFDTVGEALVHLAGAVTYEAHIRGWTPEDGDNPISKVMNLIRLEVQTTTHLVEMETL